MFKKMLQAVGVGGPSVDTVLRDDASRPGGVLSGEVSVGGASAETSIEKITLSLVAEVETDDESKHGLEFQRIVVAENFRMAAEEYQTIPFTIPLPWETPITAVQGRPLRGMRLGVRTGVAVAKAVDTSDMDPVRVEPLDSQQLVIDALLDMGAQIKGADVEHGRIVGVDQHFPFFQEIELVPPPQFAGRIGAIELTMVARPTGLDVVVEADRRGGKFTSGGDAYGLISRTHEEAVDTDWAAEITQWLETVSRHGQDMTHGHEHHGHAERRGSGMGGMLAAGAVGVVGGMALGEMFGGEDEEEGGEEEEEE